MGRGGEIKNNICMSNDIACQSIECGGHTGMLEKILFPEGKKKYLV